MNQYAYSPYNHLHVPYGKGELVYLTRFSSAGDHFLYSQDPSVCFRTDTVGRN